MKKIILLIITFVLFINIKSQILYDYTDTIVLNDTVLWGSDIFTYQADRSAKIMAIAFDFSNVCPVCNDAIIKIGGQVFKDYATPLAAPFEDANLPYTIISADSTLQKDGTYKNVKLFWTYKLPLYEISVILEDGSCGDTLQIPCYLFQAR